MKILHFGVTLLSAFITPRSTLRRTAIYTTRRYLNRIFLESSEIVYDESGKQIAELPCDDPRSVHIRDILKAQPGNSIRCGVADKGLIDDAQILESSAENGVKINLKSVDDWKTCPRPATSIIIALPRPPRLARLLPVITSLGVDKIVFIGANKVEKAYFGKNLFPICSKSCDGNLQRLAPAQGPPGAACIALGRSSTSIQ